MRSVVLMLGSVALWSLFPVLGALIVGEGDIIAFITKAWFQGFVFSLLLILISLIFGRVGPLRSFISFISSPRKLLQIIISAASNFSSHMLLFLSFTYMNKAAAATIYDTWPLIVAYAMPYIFRSKFKKMSPADMVYAMVGFCGLAILSLDAVGTQPLGRVSELMSSGHNNKALGVILAVCASLLQAFGTSLYASILERSSKKDRPFSNVIAIQALYCLSGFAFAFILLKFSGIPVPILDTLRADLATFYGVAVLVGGNLLFFLAIFFATRSSVVLLWYLTPIFALILMFQLGLAEFSIAIVVGATLIIIANILANFPGDKSLSYAATMISIGIIAAINFSLDFNRTGDELEVVAIPAGVFAILVAFMMERVSRKKMQQEEEALRVLKYLADRSDHTISMQTKSIAKKFMALLDIANPHLLSSAMNQLSADADYLGAEFKARLAQYSLNRVSTISFGELLILWLVGFTTITITVLTAPPTLSGELLCLTLGASISFMCFTVLDQRNILGGPVLRRFYCDTFQIDDNVEGSTISTQSYSPTLSMWLTILLLLIYLTGLGVKYHDTLAIS